jgi:hypothetical protein
MMTLNEIWRAVAPTVTPDTTTEAVRRAILALAPDLPTVTFWPAYDALCRLASDRRRIEAQAGSWAEPPPEPPDGGATRYTPPRGLLSTEPPHDRGRRVVRKAEPMGG